MRGWICKKGQVQRNEREQTKQLSLLLELSQAFSTLVDLEELLPVIIARTNNVLEAESCAVLLLDSERDELYFPVMVDVSRERGKRFDTIRFPADRGIAGWVLKNEQPLLVPDVAQDPRFYAAVDKQTKARTRELLCAPLRTRSGTIGVVQLRNKLRECFTQEDLTFLQALSGSIAIAIENARLYQQTRQSEARLKQEVATLQREIAQTRHFAEILGNSAAIRRVCSLMESALPSSITVLLQGETGTGKELVARAIHQNGPRKERPFVTVNCGAFQDALLESELFGHRKGAFTDAVADKVGLFEVADGGTIFLDEISEMSAALQVKLLRVLQEGEIRRVGDTQLRHVDVRIISATNQDLIQAVRHKRFREDLHYRLNVLDIPIPPLRERREDIPLLVAHLIGRSKKSQDKSIRGIDQEALELLVHYPWPGNVRELENVIERAVALATSGKTLTAMYFPSHIADQQALRIPLPPGTGTLRQARAAFEREYIAEMPRQHQGNAVQTAKVLGISRQMLQKKIKDYGLQLR